MRIWMLDLAAMVPYYTGHLCEALKGDARVDVRLASVRYRHDRECFDRHGLSNRLVLLDSGYEGPARRLAKAIEYLLNLVWLLGRAVVGRPDVVHIQFLPLLTVGVGIEVTALKLLRLLGCRIVYTVHNVLPQDSGNRLIRLYGRVYGNADRLICHDANAAERLSNDFGIPPDRITIIPHGPLFASARREGAAEARARLGVKQSECLVLWQGIVRPYKGVSFLLEVWRRIASNVPNAILVIAGTGDPDLLESIRHTAADLPRVHLDLRFLTVAEVMTLHEAADVVVYPYAEITTSGALMTGISAGKAIVASDLPAFAKVLRHEETGALAAYGDLDVWAETLTRIIRDDGYRSRLASGLKNAMADVPTWPEIARSTVDTYLAVVQNTYGCEAKATIA